jgi:hypothetical protein
VSRNGTLFAASSRNRISQGCRILAVAVSSVSSGRNSEVYVLDAVLEEREGR